MTIKKGKTRMKGVLRNFPCSHYLWVTIPLTCESISSDSSPHLNRLVVRIQTLETSLARTANIAVLPFRTLFFLACASPRFTCEMQPNEALTPDPYRSWGCRIMSLFGW
jgi:hypothetical protein